MKTKYSLVPLVLLFLLAGCTTFFQSVVTFRDVRDEALKDWAAASHAGLTTKAIDDQVIAKDAEVLKGVKVLQDALIAYKANGDKVGYLTAVAIVDASLSDLLNLIMPHVTSAQGAHLKSQHAKALAQAKKG